MRYALARLLETVFVHTDLYKWLDDYKMQPASAGPGLLRRVARALRGGGMSNWFGSGALQAYARWNGRPDDDTGDATPAARRTIYLPANSTNSPAYWYATRSHPLTRLSALLRRL